MVEVMRPVLKEPSEQRSRTLPPMRPKDAATLVVVDRRADGPHILMGRRKASLKFMPGLYVFPGGRVDPADGRMAHLGGFPDAAKAKLAARAGCRTETRMAALALAAIRETYEEAGVFIGRREAPRRVPADPWTPFADAGVTPDLGALTFVCRAITPVGRPRRFDTRFFVAAADAIGHTLPADQRPDTDLEAVEWLSLSAARAKPLAFITGVILGDLEARLARPDWADPTLPVPFYFSRGETHLRDEL